MNKEDLKKLGITDEDMLQQIIVLHGKDIESHKQTVATAQAEATNLKNMLTEANSKIEGFTQMDIEGIKKSAEEWKASAEKAKADADSQVAQMKFDYALNAQLANEKAKNAKAVRALLNIADMKLTDDGQISGLSEQLAKVKEENSYLFGSEGDGKPPRIVAGGQGKTPVTDAVIVAARKAAGLKID